MSILYAFIGAMVGGLLGHFGGVVAGGVVGWLCGVLPELRQRQEKQQQELTWLRTRLAEHLREAEAAPAATAAPAQRVETAVPVVTADAPPDVMSQVESMAPVVPVAVPEFIDLTPAGEFVFHAELQAPQPPRQPSGLEAALHSIFNGENLLVKTYW